MGRLFYWVANWNLSRAQAARLLGGNVVDMVDCTSSALATCLQSYPTIKHFAGYITGTPDIRWGPNEFAKVPGDCAILRIDQSNSDLPLLSDAKLVKDDEPGASTIAESVLVAEQRLRAGDDYTIYISQGSLAALENAIGHAGLPAGEIAAYQWASPTSNPDTLLPGTRRTLKEANADLSVALPSWLPLPGAAHQPPPRPQTADAPIWEAKISVDLATGQWRIHGTPAVKS